MNAQLTWLRPVSGGQLQPADERHRQVWNELIKEPRPELNSMLQAIYFKVLTEYIITRRPMSLGDVNRPMNKRWRTFLDKYDLPAMSIETMLHGACISKTIPISMRAMAGGRIMLLPEVVPQTLRSRIGYNIGLLVAAGRDDLTSPKPPFPAGWLDDVPDMDLVAMNECDGPILNERGYAAAYAPFESEPPVVPAVVPEIVTSDQPVDTP